VDSLTTAAPHGGAGPPLLPKTVRHRAIRIPPGMRAGPDASTVDINRETLGGVSMDRSDLRVLVADDNEHIRQLFEAVLHTAHIEPHFATNGQEALRAAELVGFDLILMDVNMPLMDGLTATRLIRDMEERRCGRRAHLVVVSCNSERSDVRAALAAGADRHLAKPFRIAELLEIAEAAARQSPGDAALSAQDEAPATLLSPQRAA
jgi:CheY-like chemotaxis protein